MKCGLNNFWWQYPRHLVCEGSTEDAEKCAKQHARNGFGYWKICDGNILIDMSVREDENCCPEITVNFWCDKCGNGYYPDKNLPESKEDLEKWINHLSGSLE